MCSLKHRWIYLLFLSLIFIRCAEKQIESRQDLKLTPSGITEQPALPECEWCGAMDAPEDLNWKMQIADDNELGRRLRLEGIIFQPDGKTPAQGVVMYVYHTNQNGVYEKRGDERGNGKRHGYLRGWIKTGQDGRYQINTVMPGKYPSRSEPAHIHHTLSSAAFDEYWISSTLFEGDELISDEMIRKDRELGKFGHIIDLHKTQAGDLTGRRNIRLKEWSTGK